MTSLQSASASPWVPDRQPTPAQAVQKLSSPTLAVSWVVFTLFHGSIVLSGFASQPSVLWPLLALYGGLLAMGWRLLAGHARWWLQGLTRGQPVLLSQPVLRAGQAQIIRVDGFKAAAQPARLRALWLHERGTLRKDGEQGVRWVEAWRSEPVALHWVPNDHHGRHDDDLEAQATMPAPPASAGSRASLMSRWSLLVVPADATGDDGVLPRLDAIRCGWRFALQDSASAAMPFAAPAVLQHLASLESAQERAKEARMAERLRVVRHPLARRMAGWVPVAGLSALAWFVFEESFQRLLMP
jgi:hypothetical protein